MPSFIDLANPGADTNAIVMSFASMMNLSTGDARAALEMVITDIVPAGAPGEILQIQVNATHIQYKYQNDAEWTNLIALSELQGPQGVQGNEGPQGPEGPGVEMRVNATHIQYRTIGSPTWLDVIALSALQGPQGEKGDPGTTDYEELQNRPTLGTAAAQDIEFFAPSSHVGSGGTAHAAAIPDGAAGFMTGADKSKLDSIDEGATINSPDATLVDRQNHTGVQAISTVTGLQSALDGKASLAGADFTGSVTLASDPIVPMQAATKQYIDGLLVNMGRRARVRAATTANITISTALNSGDTLDGVSLVNGDLVLVKDQSSAAENGIYIVGSTPERVDEFNEWDEFPGSVVAVMEGTENADTLWLCTSNKGGTIGATSIDYAKMQVMGELQAGNNLSDVDDDVVAFNNIKQAATTSYSGVVELVTAAEIRSRTANRAVTPDAIAGAKDAVALAYSASRSITWTDGWYRICTLTGDMTMLNPTSIEVGDTVLLWLTGSSATERVVSWDTYYVGALPEDPVTSTQGLFISLFAATSTTIIVSHIVVDLS